MNKISHISFLLLLCFLGFQSEAQSPYNFSLKGDGIFGGISLGILSTSVLINKKNVDPLTEQEWKLLNRDDVFRFDQYATTRKWSGEGAKARKLSDRLLLSSAIFPLVMAASRNTHDGLGAVGLLSIETMVLNMGLTNLTKGLVQRKRPFTYNHQEVPWNIMKEQNLYDARRSFFSGHTSVSASMYVLGAKMYSDFHPNSKWKPAVWATAFAVPALTGFMRVKGGKHYPTDVITGFIVGSAIGFLVPHLHKP